MNSDSKASLTENETEDSCFTSTTNLCTNDDDYSMSEVDHYHDETGALNGDHTVERTAPHSRSRDIFRQLELKFKEGWEKIKRIKSPALFAKRKGEKTRIQEISNFIDQSSFSLYTPHSLPELTRSFASLLQIPFTALSKDKYSSKPVPVVFSLIKLRLIDSEDTGRQITSNATFTFEMKYGNVETREIIWYIKKSLVDIIRLHSILNFRHIIGDVPEVPKFPSQLTYIIDLTMLGLSSKSKREARRLRHAEHRMKMLEKYFTTLLTKMGCIYCKELCEFFEISSFDLDGMREVGWKGKEGFLLNRSYNTQGSWLYMLFWLIFYCTKNTYYQKWFSIRDSFIAIFNDMDELNPIDILLVDKSFNIFYSNENSINPLKPMNVKIINGSKKIEFLVDNNYHSSEWVKDLNHLKEFSIWNKPCLFESFAPTRHNINIDFHVDAKDYFDALCVEIEKAKIEIFIHGFWVSPELYLKRPAIEYPEFRLDKLLHKKAVDGVRIFIVVYKEVSVAMSINSLHTKNSLEKLHPNISVVRHPDHLSGSIYWTHHEKMIMIDQKVAFIGGIDLCFGRYDTFDHSLTDISGIWTGIDYSNPIVRDFRNIHNHENPLIDRFKVPRLPWHDMQCSVRGSIARDLSRHFIERWNFIKVSKGYINSDRVPFLIPGPEIEVESKDFGKYSLQVVRSVSEWSSGIMTERSIYNCYLEVIRKAKHFIYIENQFFLSKTSKDQQSSLKNFIAEELILKILHAHATNTLFKVMILIPLMPAFEAFVYASNIIMQTTLHTIGKGKYSIYEVLKSNGIQDPFQYISFLSLRTHCLLAGRYVTEQIYIHSKLLIADDRYAIIGSANINDRSLLGNRDSEVCLYLEDHDLSYQNSPIGQITFGNNLRKLRMKLFNEHFEADTQDEHLQELFSLPFTDEFFEFLNDVSLTNTQIYFDVFKCIPDNSITSWDEYKKIAKQNTFSHTFIDTTIAVGGDDASSSFVDKLKQIRGRLVRFPHEFMFNEDILISKLTPEYFLPSDLYL